MPRRVWAVVGPPATFAGDNRRRSNIVQSLAQRLSRSGILRWMQRIVVAIISHNVLMPLGASAAARRIRPRQPVPPWAPAFGK